MTHDEKVGYQIVLRACRSPLTWITSAEGQPVVRAWKDPFINELFSRRFVGETQVHSGLACPTCGQSLVTAAYAGTRTYPCSSCAGILVESTRIPRIIARTGRERACTERVSSLARTVLKENQARMIYQKNSGKGAPAVPRLACPKCRNMMLRGFYSQAHLVEVDRCSNCGLTWFDPPGGSDFTYRITIRSPRRPQKHMKRGYVAVVHA